MLVSVTPHLGCRFDMHSSSQPVIHVKTQRNCVRAKSSKGFGPPKVKPIPKKRVKQEPMGSTIKVPLSQIGEKEQSQSITDKIEEKLGSMSVVFVGDNGELNDKVSEKFAEICGYTPLSSKSILEASTKQSVKSLVETEGKDTVVLTEITILEELGSMIRCSIGTMGDAWGATARIDSYRYLYGSIMVWIDTKPDEAEADAPQRGAYSEAEIHLKVDTAALKDESVANVLATGAAMYTFDNELEKLTENVVAQVLPSVLTLVDQQPDLPKNKLLYIKLGSRGDWPNIMPPDWVPGDPIPDDA